MRPVLVTLLFAGIAFADDAPNKLMIAVEPLGDNDSGVVTRTTFHFAIPSDVPQGVPLVIIGSSSAFVIRFYRHSMTRWLRFRRCSRAMSKSRRA
jgi:hypothetical protein